MEGVMRWIGVPAAPDPSPRNARGAVESIKEAFRPSRHGASIEPRVARPLGSCCRAERRTSRESAYLADAVADLLKAASRCWASPHGGGSAFVDVKEQRPTDDLGRPGRRHSCISVH
jgi:hypothetical protein